MICFFVVISTCVLNELLNNGNQNNEAVETVSLKGSYLSQGILPNIDNFNENVSMDIRDVWNGAHSDVLIQRYIEESSPALVVDSPSFRHQMLMYSSNKSKILSQFGIMEEIATRHYNR